MNKREDDGQMTMKGAKKDEQKLPAPAAIPTFLQRPVERLVRAFSPERIVLFGSYAKGTTHQGSDVDLLVVVDNVEGSNLAGHLRRAQQLVIDSFPPIDVIMCTPDDIAEAEANDRNIARSPFLPSVLGGGVVVYSRR